VGRAGSRVTRASPWREDASVVFGGQLTDVGAVRTHLEDGHRDPAAGRARAGSSVAGEGDPVPAFEEPRERFLRDVGTEAGIARDERSCPRDPREELTETGVEIAAGQYAEAQGCLAQRGRVDHGAVSIMVSRSLSLTGFC
jgi:hypothetical protein